MYSIVSKIIRVYDINIYMFPWLQLLKLGDQLNTV